MDDHTQQPPPEQPPKQPPRPRRHPRPNGRWTNPASPLQAARFARRITGKQLVPQIRAICEGRAGKPCKLDQSKLSDYETSNRRPGIEHIEAFARFYQRSPEDLGLIKWRDETLSKSKSKSKTESEPESKSRSKSRSVSRSEPAPPVTAASPQHDPDYDRLILEWLRASAVTVATAMLETLAHCPVKLTTGPNGQNNATDHPPDDDPPAGALIPD